MTDVVERSRMSTTVSTDRVRDGAVAPVAEPAGLKTGAIGFLSNVVIGVSSTAPAYSMAATLGLLVAVAGVGTHAPAVLLVSFVPMFCISLAYRALNRADPDCGTSFAWVTRALGPRLGWVTGVTIFIVGLIKVYGGSAGSQAIHPSIGWVNPFALSPGTLADGILLGVFVYWGWDACVTVNEESQDSRRGPGKAAVVSTLILLVTFVLIAMAGQSVAGPGYLVNHSTDVLSALGDKVLGGTLDKLLILVVLTSTAACPQTSIMPTARTMLSMAR